MKNSTYKFLKKILVFLFFIGISNNVFGQNTSAIVDFASQEKGVLIPRMTTQQRELIANPAEGLIVYDMTLHSFFYFDGGVWKGGNTTTTTTTSGNFWSFGGNNQSQFTTPLFGTTDYNPLIFATNNVERMRITPDGLFNFQNNTMNIGASSLIGRDLTFKQNVLLNAESGTTLINGATIIGGPALNPTTFTGLVQLNNNLAVDGITHLENTLTVEGLTRINNNLTVTGVINTKDLTVRQNIILNSESGTTLVNGTSIFGGPTFNSSTFRGPVFVDNLLDVLNLKLRNNLEVGGPASFSNTLSVDGASTLKSTLRVDGTTDLRSSLNVVGITDLRSTTNIYGVANLKSNLNVDGATDLNASLNVDGTSNLNNSLTVNGLTVVNNQFSVRKDVADGSFLATFTNLNGANGDGINIILGKAKSAYIIPAMPELLTQDQINDIKNLIRCDYAGPKIDLLGNIVINAAIEDIKIIAGLAISVGNMITGFINTQLGLPIAFGPVTTPRIDFPALSVPGIVVDVPVIPTFTLPGFNITGGFNLIPATVIVPKFNLVPAIPAINLSSFGIPEVPITSLDFWGIPNICLTDNVGTTPLNNQNEFIRFSDTNNSKMGAIRAESVSDWSNNYLNPAFLFSLRGAITSSKVDKFHAQWHFKGLISAAILSYSKIGVEYTSGNGDYAEWLERINTKELISAGDIVGVIGGKITKDLANAEQVMVVSHNPIVLGNIPPEGKTYQGNNIAFMGQVPVKILGPVATGDYIVGNNDTPGYGFAKNQKDMSIEDFKNAVGRSWENNANKGPIMVNTVVGVHNGDYLKILKKYEEKFKDTEQRFDSLESKIDVLMEKIKGKVGN